MSWWEEVSKVQKLKPYPTNTRDEKAIKPTNKKNCWAGITIAQMRSSHEMHAKYCA